jgi:hypothetical protein
MKKLIEKIKSLYPEKELQENDKIFCVLDVDNDTDEMIQEAIRVKPEYIQLNLSNPNFELWLLLHFAYHNQSLSIDETFTKLRNHIPDYTKPNIESIFQTLKENENNALTHTARLRNYHLRSDIDLNSRDANPYTSVDEVVKFLNSLVPAP